MSLSTKRRARRALAYLVSCCALLVLPVASCSDRGITEPSSRLSPSGAAFSAAIALNTRVVYLGAPNSQPINFIRARVYDENGATIGSVEQNLDPTKNAFDFSLSVQLPGARSTKARMTLELANRSAGGEVVQYSGRIQNLQLAPGDFRQVDIDLYPGPLDNFDVKGVRIVKPIHDIIEGDSVIATATVDGGTANTRIIWSSLDAAIATIDNGGKIRGVSAGVARVVAAVGTLADTASVKVNAKRAGLIVTPDVLEVSKIGDIGTYIATVIDRNGAPIANEPVLWSIADPSIGSFVSTATVQGMRIGQTTVTARAANDTSLRGTAIFRVKTVDARVARLDVSPATATLRALGATQTFVATARDSTGNVLPNVTVSWSSGTPTVATISQSGVATAVSRGTMSIVATVDSITGRASLEVNPSASDLKLVGGDAQTDTVGRTLQQAFVVRTVDRGGNAVAGVPVKFTAADGATISVTDATSNSEGIAQTQVTLGKTPGAYHVSARADSLAGSPITITANAVNGAPYAIEIERQPSSPAQNRVALTTQPIVRIVDIYGNRALHATPMITATVDSGSIDGNAAAVNAATGLATYSTMSLGGRVGDRNITFSSGSLRPATARATLIAGPPASIVAVSGATQVGQAGAGVTTVPSVRVVDVDGNPVAGATITFAVTTGNGSIVNVSATTDANGTASVGGWTLGTTAGTNTLTATVGALSTTFTATGTAGTPSSTGSTMNVSATSITAGSATPITVTIQLRDGNNNVLTTSGGTVTIASTLGTVSSVVDNHDGSYTATLTAPQTVGTALLTATLAGQPLTSSATVTITPGAPSATTTTVSVGSTSLNSNGTTTITITVRDAYGNVVTNVTPSDLAPSSSIGTIGTVACTNGVCTATYTAPGSNGNASISVSVGGTPVTSAPSIAVSAVASAVTGLTATRGNAQVSLSWTAPSSNGSAITDYFIEFKPTSGSTWSVFSHTASTGTSIVVTGLTNGTSYDFRVSAVNGVGTGSASSIATATPATTAGAPTSLVATAGASQVGLTWTAPNDGGSPITDYVIEYSTDGITWTTFTHSASTATSITVTGLTNGTAYHFRVSAVNAIGTSTPSSSANATPTLGGTPLLSVNGGNNQTATAGSAVATAPSVKALDANNNPVQGVSVTFTVASGGGSVTGASATTDAGGIATVGSWTLGTTAGANSLTASASGYTSATISATGAVGAASAATSTVNVSPTSLTANGTSTSTITVRLKDANGNNLTTGGASVTFATPSGGSIGSVTDNNDGTYTATYTAGSTAGTVTIQPKLGGTNFTNTATITLTVGAATQLAITTNASGATSGAAFTTQPVVQIRDASNNVVTGSTANVTMSVSANGVVVGTSTVAAINGVATFSNVGISGTAGTSYTLTFASAGLTSATQLITPTAGAAAQLAVITPAAGAVNGAAFGTQPVIEIQDAFGNRTSSTTTVTVATSTGSTLGGTTSVAAVNGRASFSGVSITGTAGTAYTLTYSATSLTSATQSITPTVGSDNQLAITTSAAGAASGAAFTTQPVVEIRDALGTRTSSTANVTMTVSTGGTVVGTSTVAAVGGVATFNTIGISGLVSGSPYTLTFASSGLTSATQSVALTAGAAAKLAVVASAGNVVNGSAFGTQPVIEIQDAQGNRTTSTATVTVATSTGSTLSGTTNVTAVNGHATFSGIGISGTVGTSYTLTYTSPSLTQATQTVSTTVGAATQLSIATSAAGSASGAAFTTQPVVEIHDANHNVVTASTASVTMSVSSNGTTVGTATVAAVNGVATFTTVGITGTANTSYTLTFSTTAMTSATQTITPTAGAPAKLAIVTSAASATNGTAFATQPVIEIQDAQGNRTTSTATVTVATSAGSTLSGTTSVAAVDGRASFTDVAISGTAGTAYTLTYSATSLTSTTQTITPTAGTATQLALSTNAAGAASGEAFTTQPVVQIRDASNNVVTGSTANVTMSVSANGVIVGTSTVAAINGVATFSTVGIAGTAGTSYTLTFASSGLTSATQLITPSVGAAAKLSIVTPASGAVNGVAFTTQPIIEIQDAFGNRTASTATVTVATSAGSTMGGTTSVAAVNGRATFSGVSITGTAGTAYTLTYSATSLTSATQSITPTVGVDNQLAITTNASGATSAAAFTTQPVVEIRDAVGTRTSSTANVTMTVSTGGTVVGTSTVTAVGGVATFNDVGISGLVSGSPYTLTFASSGLTSATQTITLGAGVAAKLAVITSAANATNGTAFTTQPVIEIQDAQGNRTTSTATVVIATSSGSTLSGTTSVAAVNGRATFSGVSITGTAGTAYTLTYSATSLTSATQTITPTAGTATQLSIATNAAGSASGAAFTTQPVIEIHDATNNVVGGSTANVTMSVSANGGVVGTSTVAAINGVATFSDVGIAGTAGTSYTLTFASSSLTSVTQLITPTVGAAAKLAVATAASGAVNGTAFTTQPVIEIQDSFGNRTASTTTITVATSAGSTLGGTTSVAAVNGRATFSGVSITGTAGTAYTLTYSATSLTSATQSITPTIGADDHLTITTSAAGAASGAAFTTQPVVEIRDAVGTRTSSTANVTMTVSTGGTVLGTTTVAAVSGVATFSTAGIAGLVSGSPYTLTFASSGLTSATQPIALSAGAAAKLAIITSAANATNGSAFTTQPVIEIQDAEGNRTASTATVSVGTSSGSTLSGATSVAAVNGRATFTDVAISGTAGTAYTLTYTATSLTSVTQSITPTVGAASKLSIATSAAGSASGAAFTTQPVIEIHDATNNVVTGSTANVTMSVSANGVVVGTSTVAAINGVATFSTVGIAGTAGTSYTLTFASAGLTSTTQLITPTVGAAAKLAIVTSAASATNGVAFGTQPVIEIQDSFGNRTASTTTVTVATSGGSTLGGTTSVAAVNGRATFTGISITGTTGTAYTLTYSATSLTSVTQSITPTVGADDHLTITTDAAGAASGAAFTTQPVVEIRDAVGTRTSSTTNVTMTVTSGGTVLGTSTVAAVGGIATFSNVGISGLVSGSPYTLTFASSGLTSATQPVALTAGAPAKLAVITTAAGAASGTAFSTQPVIEIQDAAGNRTTSTATISVGTSAGSTLGGTTSVTAVSGRATFTDVAISGTAGTAYTLTYTATSLTSTTQTITPSAGTPTQLALSTNAAGAVSGAAFTTQPVVQIRDANGNVITTSTANVTMSVSANGQVVGTATVAAINGVASFTNIGISGTAGTSYTLTFASASLTSATQLITPTAGAASQLAIVTSAAGASNGAAFATQPVIELQDAFGNRTTSTASVTVGVSVGGTTVGTVTVAAVNGRATFTDAGITGTPGTNYTLTYSAPSVTSVTQNITANAGADNQLAVTTNAAGAASGAAFTTQPIVEIRDASGARTASTANVAMTVSAGGTVLGTTTVAAVAGVATFSNVGISGLVSGSPYTLTFASSGLTSVTQSITLTAGAASKLAVITQAAAVVSGSAFATQPVIEIQDAAGNRTTSTANVTIATSSGSTLGGTTTVAAVNGRATFSGVTLTGTTGTTYTLTYSSSSLTSATQTIVPTGTPTKLIISTSAAGAAAGLAFTTQPVITIADASNQQTGSTAAVTMTVSASGTVIGTSTVNAVAGVATFGNVGIGGTVGSYTLTFASSGLTSATQSITLTYGTGSQLFLLTAAAADSNGKKANTQPVIQVKDAYGNVRTGDNTTQVTASVDNSAYTVGTVTKTAASGAVTYTDFGILGLAGTSYTITYASSGMTSITQTLVPIATNSAQLRAVACTQTNSPTGNARTSIGLAICSQAQTGDVLVAMVATTNMSAASAITAPTGWTRRGLVQTSGGNILGAVFTKTATSTDATSTATFDFGSNAGKVGGVISVFKNVVVDVASNGSVGTSAAPSDAVTTSSGATTSTIVFLVGLDPAGTLSSSGSTYFFENLAAVNGASGSKTGMFSRDGVGPSTSSTGTATSTNNSWTAFSIALKWTQVP